MRLSPWMSIGLLLFGVCFFFTVLTAKASPENAASPKLKGVRIHLGESESQIILDLSSNPQDLKIQSSSSSEMTVSFSGDLAPGMKPEVKTFSQPNLQQVYWESTGEKVQVFLKLKVPDATKIYPLKEPDRLVFDISNRVEKGTRLTEISPGIHHAKIYRSTKRGPLLINVLEIDPQNPNLEILPVLASGKMVGKARVSTIAEKNQALAGINASFFKPDQGIPLGLLVINEELVTGPLFDRVALGITNNQTLRMARVGMRGELQKGDIRIRLDNVNQPRTSMDQTVLYTSRWGATAPRMPTKGIQIQLQHGRITAVSNTTPLSIPYDGYVISCPLTPQVTSLLQSPVEQPAMVSFFTIPDWSDVKHALSGGPYLIKNGQIYVDPKAQRFNFSVSGSYAPRSAAGITADGKLLLVTVDGRQKNVSVGVSLTELAYLMKQLGATEAMNLDGGSSTQMVIGGRLVNSPSAGQGVGVSTCLVIRKSAQATLPPTLPPKTTIPYPQSRVYHRSSL